MLKPACSPGPAKLPATGGEILTNVGLRARGLFQEPAGEENETKVKWYTLGPTVLAAGFSKCGCNFLTEEGL